jgi:hypothetical protein
MLLLIFLTGGILGALALLLAAMCDAPQSKKSISELESGGRFPVKTGEA